MHFVIFGLTLSSSWGNGHATLWRGLVTALADRGHTIAFFEKDVPYYADSRDSWPLPAGVTWFPFVSEADLRSQAEPELVNADVAMVTSYCGESTTACNLVLNSHATVRAFYDLDTPVTLDALQTGSKVPYVPNEGLAEFDLVLSYTGGLALNELQTKLGARRVAPLYGWVDAQHYVPAESTPDFRAELSYLGTYAADRQVALEELFVRTAQALPAGRFAIGGAQYPDDFPWAQNIFFVRHLPPSLHPTFFCSSRATLNVTRRAMATYGYCPSGRLFEATACGTAILTDVWEGLDSFFNLGTEILPVSSAKDVVRALSLSDIELQRIATAGRERTLGEHTAQARAMQLESLLDDVAGSSSNRSIAQQSVLA